MLISHESPLCLLEESLNYNDYDYALVHLFKDNPEYYKFFKDSIARGREVILDNSIFELKTAFNPVEFAKWVGMLQPTYYIVPDALEDCVKTMQQFRDFYSNYNDLPGMRIGVVQGKTYQELKDCYMFMAELADYIAISFDYSYYEETGTGYTLQHQRADGRQRLIKNLIDDKVWNFQKPVHLLGCSLPQEFCCDLYKDSGVVRSVDTSSPIMAGINRIRYSGKLGLNKKPIGLLADNLKIDLDSEQKQIINYNIEKFHKIANE